MVTKNMPYVKYMTKMILSNIFNYPQSSDFLRYNHFYSVLWQNKIYDIKVFSVQKWDTPKIRQNKILVCDDKILVSRNKTPQKIWASKYYAHLMFIFFYMKIKNVHKNALFKQKENHQIWNWKWVFSYTIWGKRAIKHSWTLNIDNIY